MKTRMKKVTSLMLTAAMVAGTMTGMTSFTAKAEDNTRPVQKEFYVSVNGDDANDGSENAPFATVEKAREAVDAINDNMTGDIIVNIKEGNYYLDETIVLGKSDSGTNGFEVIYRSADGVGKASLKGGLKVENEWTLATQDDVDNFDMSADMLGKVYKVDLGEETPDFNTLYVNGKRVTMARTQNRNDSERERFPASKDTYMEAAGGSRKDIRIKDGAVTPEQMQAMKNAIARGEEAALVYAWESGVQNWFTSTLPITAIEGNTLKFPASPADNPQLYEPKYPYWARARYFLQGNLSFLDVPGEYHYNKKENVLYYYPKEGEENLAEQEVVYPVLQEVFSLKGDAKAKVTDAPAAENQVHNVTFQGLEMGYTEFNNSYSSGWNAYDSGMGGSLYVFPDEALEEGITQPSYCEQTERKEFRKGVLTLSQTNHITVDSARIVNAGLHAINAWGDNAHLTVKNSEIAHIGIHGINIDGGYPGPNVGKYSYGHVITNNIIHDMGELAGHGTGLQILQTHDSEFSHMEMYNAARRAIFLEGAWYNRIDSEKKNLNRMTDAHTYNNHLEYLYLHDLQQDGGDDGAIFICTLYGTQDTGTDYTEDQYRRNYLNQIYMDNVGAPNSNKDYKPNCINLDMGCKGATLSNFKAVNPEHYNVRWDENDPDVFFENVNMAYYHPKKDSNYTNFDESKMEYDKIGVNDAFPYKDAMTSVVGKADKTDAEYKDLYFRDEFDNGLDNWWKLAGKPGTSPLYYSDNDDWTGNSFLADAFYGENKSSTGCLIGKPFGKDLNKIVEIDFFDHTNDGMENGYCGMAFQYKLNSFARVDNGKTAVGIGVNSDVNSVYYAYKVGDTTEVTEIPRSYGWHTFKWDYTSGKDVTLYIDDEEIATVPAASFNYVEMGDYGMGGFNAYDNVVIFDGTDAGEVMPLPEAPKMGVDTALNTEKTEVTLDVKASMGDEDIKLEADDVTITSGNAGVAVVEGNVVKAVNPGIAKITVRAVVFGFPLTNEFYVKVNENGTIKVLTDYEMVDLPLDGMTATAGSAETVNEDNKAANAIDNNNGSFWHTKWSGAALEDRWIDVAIGESKAVNGLRILPRQSGDNGKIKKYRIEVSNDNGATYKEVATGTWGTDADWKTVEFPATDATNVRIYAVESVGNYASAAEIRIMSLERHATTDSIFTVTVNGEETEYHYNDAVTVKAPEAEENMKFAGWEANGKIVSYTETYKFYVSEDVELTAKYVEDTAEVEEKAEAMLKNVFVTKRNDGKSDVKFVGELALPEGYKVVEAGLVWSSKDAPLTVGDGWNPDLKPTFISKISDTNQFSVTIKGMPAGRFLRGSIFAKVKDADGKESYIFSAEKKVYAAK